MNNLRITQSQGHAIIITSVIFALLIIFIVLIRFESHIVKETARTIDLYDFDGMIKEESIGASSQLKPRDIEKGNKEVEVLDVSVNGLLSHYVAPKAMFNERLNSKGSAFDQENADPFYGKNEPAWSSNNFSKNIFLPGRSVVNLQKPLLASESGIVVVTIMVDKNGKVVKAEANGRGTNTASTELKTKACEAALASIFSPSGSVDFQSGTIIYRFEF